MDQVEFKASPIPVALGAIFAGVSAYGHHNWTPPTNVPYSLPRAVIPMMAVGAVVGLAVGNHYPERFNLPSYWTLKPFVPEGPTE